MNTKTSNGVKKLLAVMILVTLLVPVGYTHGQGFSLVPCGTSNDPEECKFSDLITLIVRVINYMLAASAIVAMFFIFISAWKMMTAMGNPERISGAKESLTRAIIGFGIVLLSFAFINFLLITVLGIQCTPPWWQDMGALFSDSSCFLD